MKRKKILLLALCAIFIIAVSSAYFLFFTPFASDGKPAYIYIDADDTNDSLHMKLSCAAPSSGMSGFRILASLGLNGNLRPGRYAVGEGMSAFRIMRNIRNGRQVPMRLTIPAVRTIGDLSRRLGRVLMADSALIAAALNDEKLCERFGKTQATVSCLFIPNTYEVMWTITPEALMERMARESKRFWTRERLQAAEKIGLSPDEVITLASIVDQETANNAEKPSVAAMYLNRLRIGMKLQADPTVKFALGHFGLRRILHEHLTVDSPYNTYIYAGLPPGPIAIPQVSSIDAVLHPDAHSYLYMCAREDFSGTHRFAETYQEHLENARRYSQALNRRGIMR